MMGNIEIIDTNADNIHEYAICGYKNKKHEGYTRKLEWLTDRFSQGLEYKILYSEDNGAVGGIEYIPGEYAWRPVEASGYMVIHCVYIVSRKYKEKGYGSLLVEACVEDAKQKNMQGVTVVTRKGSWMAGKQVFIKHGFEVVDSAKPDFELLVKRFDDNAPAPKFKGDWEQRLSQYDSGLTIIRSDQCPFLAKAVPEMLEIAEKEFGITPTIIELNTFQDAQDTPSPFGTFCVVYNGKVVADNPISKTRFSNIMKKELG